MSNIAIVMTGHPRYVPQGFSRINTVRKENKDLNFDIFSYTWSDATDPRGTVPQHFYNGTEDILHSLGDRLVLIEQKPILEKFYNELLSEGCIPHAFPADGYPILTKEAAIRCSAQLINFMLALKHWQSEWRKYDYIIKLRWDYTFDVESLRKLIKVKHADIITTEFRLRHGQVELTVDAVYGTRDAMLMSFTPYDSVLNKIKQELKTHRQLVNNTYDKSLQFVNQSEWFTDGLMWYFAVKNKPVSVYQGVEGRFLREVLL